jgi:tRNA(Ile)-lysidine synthase
LLRRVKKYIEDHGLLDDGNKILVCVSGGADSVALLDVLLRTGCECVVAHCNFHLRGKESDRDEAFVRELCRTLGQRLKTKPTWLKDGIPLHVKHFETADYAKANKKSIELAARELRYQWFAEVAKETGCNAIAVAHHQNDQAETILMNIRRGCGLKGLAGMAPKSRNPYCEQSVPIIRPLLCTTHDYICHYLRDIRHIEWVEDSTNSDTTYRRNAIRAELAQWSKAEIEHLATLGGRL